MPSSVVLPAPLRPRSAWIFPCSKDSDTSSSAVVFPNRFVKCVGAQSHAWSYPFSTRSMTCSFVRPSFFASATSALT